MEDVIWDTKYEWMDTWETTARKLAHTRCVQRYPNTQMALFQPSGSRGLSPFTGLGTDTTKNTGWCGFSFEYWWQEQLNSKRKSAICSSASTTHLSLVQWLLFFLYWRSDEIRFFPFPHLRYHTELSAEAGHEVNFEARRLTPRWCSRCRETFRTGRPFFLLLKRFFFGGIVLTSISPIVRQGSNTPGKNKRTVWVLLDSWALIFSQFQSYSKGMRFAPWDAIQKTKPTIKKKERKSRHRNEQYPSIFQPWRTHQPSLFVVSLADHLPFNVVTTGYSQNCIRNL